MDYAQAIEATGYFKKAPRYIYLGPPPKNPRALLSANSANTVFYLGFRDNARPLRSTLAAIDDQLQQLFCHTGEFPWLQVYKQSYEKFFDRDSENPAELKEFLSDLVAACDACMMGQA